MDTVIAHKVDALSNMFTLAIENIGQVERKERLVSTHDEKVWVALGVNPDQGSYSIDVFLVEFLTTFALDSVINPGLLDFESGGVNEHVNLVLRPVEYRARFADFCDPFALSVDECDCGEIEGR